MNIKRYGLIYLVIPHYVEAKPGHRLVADRRALHRKHRVGDVVPISEGLHGGFEPLLSCLANQNVQRSKVQGDTSACSQGFVDIKIKVAF